MRCDGIAESGGYEQGSDLISHLTDDPDKVYIFHHKPMSGE